MIHDEKMSWKDDELDTAADPAGTGRVLKHDDDDPAGMPLGMGEFGDDLGAAGFNTDSGASRSSRLGLLLLLLIVLVGGGSLWLMRVTGAIGTSNPQLADAEAKIEKALQQFIGSKDAKPGDADQALKDLFKDTDKVIDQFKDDPAENQVAVDEVQKNPFELFVKAPQTTVVRANTNDAAKREADRKRALEAELARLTLSSVLIGKQPVAVISDQVLRKGQVIGSFTVDAISPKSVKLKTDAGDEFKLELKENSDDSTRGHVPFSRLRR